MNIIKKVTAKLLKRLPLSYYPYKPFMHKYQCVFIHIPKNAGSSVLSLFNDKGGRKHAKWYDFYEANDYFYQTYYKFAIVREPLNRLFSAYNYAVSGGNQSMMDIALMQYIVARCDNFEGFIVDVLTYDFMMQQPLFLPQYLYVFDRDLNCNVDCLLAYECLADDWLKLSEQLTLPSELPWKNASMVSAFPSLSVASFNKVIEMYSFDYQLLDYAIPSQQQYTNTQSTDNKRVNLE